MRYIHVLLTCLLMVLCSILDMVRRNNYRILKLMLKLPISFKKRDLDVALAHAVKAGFFECAKVPTASTPIVTTTTTTATSRLLLLLLY